MDAPLTDGDNAPTINSYLSLVIVMYGGGVLKLGPGVYNLSTSINIPNNTCIVGSGKNTTLRAGADLKSVVGSNNAIRVSITRCSIDAARNASIALSFTSTKYVYVSHVNIFNTRSDGVRIAENSTQVHLENLYIKNTNKNAIIVSNSHDVKITRSMAVHPVKHGVVVSKASKSVLVELSTIQGSEVAVSAKPGAYNLTLRDLNITECARTAIWVKRALFTRIVRVNIESAPLCYRVTEAVVVRVDGSCNGKRTYRGPKLGLNVCAKGILPKVCCPQWCGTCGAPNCLEQADNGHCCTDKVMESKRVCGEKAPPCMFKK